MDLAVLEDWNTHWSGGPVSPLILRHPEPRAAVPHMVEELVAPRDPQWSLRPGPRQIGKTTSLGHVTMDLLARGVSPHRIVIAPMDQPAVAKTIDGDLQALIQAALESHPADPDRPLFLLLDEIQDLPEWDLQLKTAWDRYQDRVRVTATGSSALRLVRSTGASLANRIRKTRMYPMKFREVLAAHPDRSRHLDDHAWNQFEALARTARKALLDGKDKARAALRELHGWIAAQRGLDAYLHAVFLEYCVWGGYPPVRPGGQKQGVERVEFFEAVWGSIVARDLPHAGVRDLLGFNRMFQAIGENTGGKFVPANTAKIVQDVKSETVKAWKQILEDLHLVQQLPPLRPNLRLDKAKDKVYLLNTGWFAHWRHVLDHTTIIGRPEMGALIETVVHDHLRRLRYNLLRSTTGRIGYVRDPEIDFCMQLGERWLLVEVKSGGSKVERLNQVGDKNDLRIVVSSTKNDLRDEDLWIVPGHEFLMLC